MSQNAHESTKSSSSISKVPECPNTLSTRVTKCLSALRVPDSRVRFEYLQCLSALRVYFKALCVLECLIRCDENKMLNTKRCFMYMNKEINGIEDFEELNFEAESKR